jgi:hypothetical protein
MHPSTLHSYGTGLTTLYFIGAAVCIMATLCLVGAVVVAFVAASAKQEDK